MENSFFPIEGSPTPPAELGYSKAKDLALRLLAQQVLYASLVECRRINGVETVVFDVRVEVPSRPVHRILPHERIAASFYESDNRLPKVDALRSDFPVVPHLNLNIQEYPRNLCLYEERYEELKRRWTAARFVHRIREWLALTSRGELHQQDQRLEPLLVDYWGHIVLPPDLATNVPEQLFLTAAPGSGGRFLLAHRQPPADTGRSFPIVASVHSCDPQTHGVVNRCPTTLADVARIAATAGLNLIAELRGALPRWKEGFLDCHVVLVILFPKTRATGGRVELPDPWCFATSQTVRQLGVRLGIWEEMSGSIATLLKTDDEKRGQDVSVSVLNPCLYLTRDDAALLNGIPKASDLKIVGVGVGALGSQIVTNLSRSGFGRWTLIDADRLMPHNVARHALSGSFVGWNKAETVAAYAASVASFGEDVFTGLSEDLLRPGARFEEAKAALSAADAIVDMTASVAAQRHLARDTKSSGRRLCGFLNPSGSDLIILAEDAGRHFTLDALEMQYYRALLNEGALAGHLELPTGRQRYARSCGDTTSVIPHDSVALHAAIASRTIKEILARNEPFIGVWRADSSCSVRHVPIAVHKVIEFRTASWTVVLDDGVLARLRNHRHDKLSNETGGVLLGSFDLDRQILYIVDTLPSPSDSHEQRDLYIRGYRGLRKAVDDVDARTAGMIEYVGEWHSHPSGASTAPSDFDLAAFGWLTRLMANDSLPAAMMIVGDREASLFVGSMSRAASPIPEGHCG